MRVLEYGTYSVISPEGGASILWKDGGRVEEAALRLRMTAPDLLRLGVVDKIVEEPAGGAHQDHDHAARLVDAAGFVRTWPHRDDADAFFAARLVRWRQT